jgi:hypothetical protein
VLSGRALAIAVAVLAVLWLAFDSKWVSSDPAMPNPSLSLGMLAVVFGVGAWVMQAGGRSQRVPLLVGTALGCAAYVALHAIGFAP